MEWVKAPARSVKPAAWWRDRSAVNRHAGAASKQAFAGTAGRDALANWCCAIDASTDKPFSTGLATVSAVAVETSTSQAKSMGQRVIAQPEIPARQGGPGPNGATRNNRASALAS
eukprot:scaffold3759_cov119-Isochrysis_galbana.AAC.4